MELNTIHFEAYLLKCENPRLYEVSRQQLRDGVWRQSEFVSGSLWAQEVGVNSTWFMYFFFLHKIWKSLCVK